MIKVKNVRPGILIIADAGIKLAPGETTDVQIVTAQMERCLDDGLLARIDSESEVQQKAKSANRSNAPKAEAKKQSAKAADTEPKPEPDDSNGDSAGKSSGAEAGDPGGHAGAEPAAADGAQPEIPGVGNDGQ